MGETRGFEAGQKTFLKPALKKPQKSAIRKAQRCLGRIHLTSAQTNESVTGEGLNFER
jgi:hypothetical protein